MAALVEQYFAGITVSVKYARVVWQPESQLSYIQQTLKCAHNVTNKWPTADRWGLICETSTQRLQFLANKINCSVDKQLVLHVRLQTGLIWQAFHRM